MCSITSFRLKCRLDIEATIDVPPTGFFVKNHETARICYKIGCELKYINLTSRLEIAKLLKKHRLIYLYSITDQGVKMFKRDLLTITGEKGQPVQYYRMVEMKWKDVDLSAGQVQTIAAVHELDNNIVVKSFINQVFKVAS